MDAHTEIGRVAIVGTGLIGSSWAACFLAHGLDVVATDPAPGTEDNVREYVEAAWSALTKIGLAPGASTKTIALRSQLGYTGTEARALMLKNHQFVDVRVQLFVKYGGDQWVKLGEWPVSRELLTQ